MRRTGNDRGAMRTATITWVVIVMAIIGVFGYDGFGIMTNNVHTEDNAQDAAFAASQSWHHDPSLSLAYQAAVASIVGTGDKVLTKDFSVDPDGTIHLLVRHTVQTLVFSRVGALRHYTVAVEHGDANSQTP